MRTKIVRIKGGPLDGEVYAVPFQQPYLLVPELVPAHAFALPTERRLQVLELPITARPTARPGRRHIAHWPADA